MTTSTTARTSPPSSSTARSAHLPRVALWIITVTLYGLAFVLGMKRWLSMREGWR